MDRFPIKRTLGEKVKVRADILTDGHDAISGLLLFRHESDTRWRTAAWRGFANDKWKASFKVTELGRYRLYTVRLAGSLSKAGAGILAKRIEAGQDVTMDLLTGAAIVEEAIARAPEPQRAVACRLRATRCVPIKTRKSEPGWRLTPRLLGPHGAVPAGPLSNDVLPESS